jgi:VRR-NUC domain
MATTGTLKLPPVTEAEFTAQVIAFARLHGWRVAHFRAARTAQGWRTAVQGDGAGFPDLVLVKGTRMIVAELKAGRGKTTPEQDAWLTAFAAAGVSTFVWRPGDWRDIERVLAVED